MLIYKIEKALDNLKEYLTNQGKIRLNTFYRAHKETPDFPSIIKEYIQGLNKQVNIILRSFLKEALEKSFLEILDYLDKYYITLPFSKISREI